MLNIESALTLVAGLLISMLQDMFILCIYLPQVQL